MIERYTLGERIIHWISALTYMYVLATGLAFYSPYLFWIAAALGGGSTSRYWHPWIGLLFLATLVWMIRAWRGDLRITDVDRQWGRSMKHYARNEDELVPPSDRYNLGQKYYFWAMVWAGLVLLFSGAILWMPELIPWSWRGLRFASILLHVAAALVTVGAFMIHVYMGVFAVRGGFSAVVTGQVSANWAKHHHRLWYHRLGGK